jgi:hypothetical protein
MAQVAGSAKAPVEVLLIESLHRTYRQRTEADRTRHQRRTKDCAGDEKPALRLRQRNHERRPSRLAGDGDVPP